jgi:hypothetical protein
MALCRLEAVSRVCFEREAVQPRSAASLQLTDLELRLRAWFF